MNSREDTRPPSHFCGLLLARFSAQGLVEFLVLDYYHFVSGRTSIKFPGGTSEEGEVPFVDLSKTLRREAREEVGDQVEIMLSDEWISDRVVMKVEGPANASGEITHRKYFFLIAIDEISGCIRQNKMDDGDAKLSIPRWVSAEHLYDHIFPTHFPAFVMGLKWVCELFEISSSRYSYIFRNKRVMEIIEENGGK